MKKNLTLLLFSVFILFSNSKAQWVKLNSGTSGHLFDLSFPTNDTGYEMNEDGTLRRTINAGQSWTYVNSTPLYKMDFTTVDTGLGTGDCRIYKTTDAGISWASVFFDTTIRMSNIYNLDINNSFVCAYTYTPDSIAFLKTNDGGNSWSTLRLKAVGPTEGIYFANQSTGYIVTDYVVIKTTDGGSTWNTCLTDSTGEGFVAFSFISENVGFTMGGYGTILRTTDGGLTWAKMNTMGNATLFYALKFITPNIGYVVGGDGITYGTILKTINGGLTWDLDTSTSQTFIDLAVTKDEQAFACGLGGILLKMDGRVHQEICMITVDSVSGKNEIIWEKDSLHKAKKYKLYKEGTSVGVYNLLDTVTATAYSTYIDNTSNPGKKADRYALTFIDSTGKESPKGGAHKTIHLTVSKGIGNSWNLVWDQYEGFPYSTYYIMRGNYAGNVVVIDSVQNSLTSYTDLNPTATEIYYAISIINPAGCNPSFIKSGDHVMSVGSPSFSNIVNRQLVGVDELSDRRIDFTIYPNPVKDQLTIDNGQFKIGNTVMLGIYNVLGEKILQAEITSEKLEINVSGLLKGVYIIELCNERKVFRTKMVKE